MIKTITYIFVLLLFAVNCYAGPNRKAVQAIYKISHDDYAMNGGVINQLTRNRWNVNHTRIMLHESREKGRFYIDNGGRNFVWATIADAIANGGAGELAGGRVAYEQVFVPVPGVWPTNHSSIIDEDPGGPESYCRWKYDKAETGARWSTHSTVVWSNDPKEPSIIYQLCRDGWVRRIDVDDEYLEPLQGSINTTASTAVVGIGTAFTTELADEDEIVVGGVIRSVDGTPSDNTHLNVTIAFPDLPNDTTPEKYVDVETETRWVYVPDADRMGGDPPDASKPTKYLDTAVGYLESEVNTMMFTTTAKARKGYHLVNFTTREITISTDSFLIMPERDCGKNLDKLDILPQSVSGFLQHGHGTMSVDKQWFCGSGGRSRNKVNDMTNRDVPGCGYDPDDTPYPSNSCCPVLYENRNLLYGLNPHETLNPGYLDGDNAVNYPWLATQQSTHYSWNASPEWLTINTGQSWGTRSGPTMMPYSLYQLEWNSVAETMEAHHLLTRWTAARWKDGVSAPLAYGSDPGNNIMNYQYHFDHAHSRDGRWIMFTASGEEDKFSYEDYVLSKRPEYKGSTVIGVDDWRYNAIFLVDIDEEAPSPAISTTSPSGR